MRKSTLTIPTPESCSECSFKIVFIGPDDKIQFRCGGDKSVIGHFTTERHPDCPLVAYGIDTKGNVATCPCKPMEDTTLRLQGAEAEILHYKKKAEELEELKHKSGKGAL